MSSLPCDNHIGGIIVSVLASTGPSHQEREIVGSSPNRVKPKTIKLLFVPSPPST